MALSTLFDHFRAVRKWGLTHQAKIRLDINTFQLEIRCANRYFHFYPLFSLMSQGQLVYTSTLVDSVGGFCGWRPYKTYHTPLTQDKRVFKTYFKEQGLSVPDTWYGNVIPDKSYILKNVNGSFGEGIRGPFSMLTNEFTEVRPVDTGVPEMFTEQFIEGRCVKVWLWGAQSFCADIQDWPTLHGDGIHTIAQLLEQRLHGPGFSAFGADTALTQACLVYQNLRPETIPEADRTVWIDFRYGRTFKQPSSASRTANCLTQLQQRCGPQLAAAQAAVAKALQQTVPAPVICSIDAVLDAEDRLWWLELNSNPLLPHYGYEVMLNELFSRSAPRGTHV